MTQVILDITEDGETEFCEENSIPKIPDPKSTDEKPMPDIDEYSFKEHVERWLMARFESECQQGRIKIDKKSRPTVSPRISRVQ